MCIKKCAQSHISPNQIEEFAIVSVEMGSTVRRQGRANRIEKGWLLPLAVGSMSAATAPLAISLGRLAVCFPAPGELREQVVVLVGWMVTSSCWLSGWVAPAIAVAVAVGVDC